jgi:hypothetical protein
VKECDITLGTSHVKLINKAYDVLKNPLKRSDYDNTLKIVKKNSDNFMEMKRSAHKFLETFEMNQTELKDARINAEKEYEQKSRDIDRKMGIENQISINRKIVHNPTANEMDKYVSQLETLRDQEYIENIPMKICDEKDFNIVRFNKAFDSIAEESKLIGKYTGETIPYNEINVCNIDDDNNTNTTDILTDPSGKNINDNIMKPNLKFVPSTRSLEDLMEERCKETNKLHNMKMYEYDLDNCIDASGSRSGATKWSKQ